MKALLALNPNTQGILCLIGAIAFLTISDSIIKWLSPQLPLHEIMLFRGVIASLFLVFIIRLEGGFRTLKTRRPGLHILRGTMLVLANMFFFTGLATMPLAETIALFFTAPLFICMLSQPILGERVGWARWLAILLGLVGVIIMVRPGSDVFRLVSLLPIMAALSYAAMQMMTRKLGMRESAGAMTFYIQLAFIVISIGVGLSIGDGRFDRFDDPSISFLLRAWHWPEQSQLELLLLCGFMVTFGGYLLSQAYRLGEAAAVASFEYSSMPLALVIGFYLWGDWPDSTAFFGSGLIIFSGLLVVYFEHRSTRKRLYVNPVE